MPIRRGQNERRSSEQDVALMQMQIAAQTRNQRWHDFLCGKRDELQARLRQQGYSQDGIPGARREEPALLPGAHSLQDVHGVSADVSSSASTRWGLPEVEAESMLDTGDYQPESQVGDDVDDAEDGGAQAPGMGSESARKRPHA
jgi:hypothetical protein